MERSGLSKAVHEPGDVSLPLPSFLRFHTILVRADGDVCSWEPIRPCGGISNPTYCCDPNGTGYDCCAKKEELFSLPVPSLVTVIDRKTSDIQSATGVPALTLTSDGGFSSMGATSAPVTVATTTATSAAGAKATAGAQSTTNLGDLGAGAKVGIVVGGVVGLTLLGLLAWLMVRHRRLTQEMRNWRDRVVNEKDGTSRDREGLGISYGGRNASRTTVQEIQGDWHGWEVEGNGQQKRRAEDPRYKHELSLG